MSHEPKGWHLLPNYGLYLIDLNNIPCFFHLMDLFAAK